MGKHIETGPGNHPRIKGSKTNVNGTHGSSYDYSDGFGSSEYSSSQGRFQGVTGLEEAPIEPNYNNILRDISVIVNQRAADHMFPTQVDMLAVVANDSRPFLNRVMRNLHRYDSPQENGIPNTEVNLDHSTHPFNTILPEREGRNYPYTCPGFS